MLSTKKIEGAFNAICEEAEKLKTESDTDKIKEGLSKIVSIAKHQSDIRQSKKGSCKASASSRRCVTKSVAAPD